MSKPLSKAELVAMIADQSGQSKSSVNELLIALEIVAKIALKSNVAITIPGLVKLTPKDREARTGRNPSTGAPVEIPAKRVVAAKAVSTILA